MRATILALCLVACAAGNLRSRTQRTGNHPVVGVITLLKSLSEKAKAEGATEEIAYTKFDYWCRTSKSTLSADISKRKANIDSLGDTVEAKTGEEKSLQSKISELDNEITAQEASKSKATSNRNAANSLFVTTDKDLEDTIQACADCIAALEGAYNKTEGVSLLSVQGALGQVRDLFGLLEVKATAKQLDTLQDFLKNSSNTTKDPVKALGDYEKHIDVYKFKSDSVVELLKDLKEKFEEEKLAGVKAETNSLNAFTLQVKELDNSISAANASKNEKALILVDVQTDLNAAKTEKGIEEDAVDASEGTLKTTKQECTLKASEWQERSDIRKNEIAAIESAIDILSKVTGVRAEAPKNPTLPTSFLQLNSSAGPKDAKAKAVQLLRAAAKTSHSRALERLAMAISSKSLGIHYNKPGAFDEIINMIQKMIYKLQADQTSEDKHKLWCDQELEKTNNSITDKTEKVTQLGTKITSLKATEADLTQKIADDAKMIEDLTAKMKELTEIREVGKKENALAIKDAEDAITAISEATAVLTEFYKSSGAIAKQPWEFIQADPAVELPEKPALWGSSYTSVADPTKQDEGIIAMLDTISQKFSQMVADTKAQEATDHETFNNEKKAATIEMARLRQESEEYSEQKRRTNTNIQSEEDTKKHVQKELDAWNQYDLDLKPACVDGDASYNDRKAARDTEIEALRQAETILKTAFDGLSSNSSLFLQIRRHLF